MTSVEALGRRADGSVQLLVCVTCRHSGAGDPPEPKPGAVLRDRLLAAALPAGVRVHGVACLSNCSRGCTIALRGGGRWTYVYGNIDSAAHVAAVIEGTTRYAASHDGLVPWRERPEHFRKNCIARIPPVEVCDD
ncbi:MAG: DUF1636 domain-containing protein [Rhodospirillales bacterium]|nr:MAG: DUF1636 domain-containing protein [Rhodospirillales bacterium]